jgi:hypothetical protein
MIEDFAVVGDPERTILIGHRLSIGRQVNDAQAPVTQCRFAIDIEAVCIWTTMCNLLRHSADDARICTGSMYVNDPCDPAHSS